MHPLMYKEVPAKRVDEILDATFGVQLKADGFQPIRKRLWGRVHLPWLTDLFSIYALKGAQYVPRWGFSVNYVPHLKNGRLAWHRTLKSAQFDLVVDPLDAASIETVPSLRLSRLHGEQAFREQSATLCPFAVAQADHLWQRIKTVQDLRDALLDMKTRTNTVRFGFYNYMPHPITLAFTLARLGGVGEAEGELLNARLGGNAGLREAFLEQLRAVSPERGA